MKTSFGGGDFSSEDDILKQRYEDDQGGGFRGRREFVAYLESTADAYPGFFKDLRAAANDPNALRRAEAAIRSLQSKEATDQRRHTDVSAVPPGVVGKLVGPRAGTESLDALDKEIMSAAEIRHWKSGQNVSEGLKNAAVEAFEEDAAAARLALEQRATAGFKRGDPVTEVTSLKKIETLKSVAERYGMNINVLHQAGEKYTHVSRESYIRKNSADFSSGGSTVYEGVVPKDNAYIEIAGGSADLSEFWRSVKLAEFMLEMRERMFVENTDNEIENFVADARTLKAFGGWPSTEDLELINTARKRMGKQLLARSPFAKDGSISLFISETEA